MRLAELTLRYTAFAVIATVANLAVQRLSLMAYDGAHGIGLAILAGTGAGLVVKYALDKRWIFNDRSTGLKNHSRKFGLYTLMGVLTTMIFWGTELAFWRIWQTDPMREAGAVLGLSIGYFVKYQLDKRYVFRPLINKTEREAGARPEAAR